MAIGYTRRGFIWWFMAILAWLALSFGWTVLLSTVLSRVAVDKSQVETSGAKLKRDGSALFVDFPWNPMSSAASSLPSPPPTVSYFTNTFLAVDSEATSTSTWCTTCAPSILPSSVTADKEVGHFVVVSGATSPLGDDLSVLSSAEPLFSILAPALPSSLSLPKPETLTITETWISTTTCSIIETQTWHSTHWSMITETWYSTYYGFTTTQISFVAAMTVTVTDPPCAAFMASQVPCNKCMPASVMAPLHSVTGLPCPACLASSRLCDKCMPTASISPPNMTGCSCASCAVSSKIMPPLNVVPFLSSSFSNTQAAMSTSAPEGLPLSSQSSKSLFSSLHVAISSSVPAGLAISSPGVLSSSSTTVALYSSPMESVLLISSNAVPAILGTLTTARTSSNLGASPTYQSAAVSLTTSYSVTPTASVSKGLHATSTYGLSSVSRYGPPDPATRLASDVTCAVGYLPRLDVNGIIQCVVIPLVTGLVGDASSVIIAVESFIGNIVSGVPGDLTSIAGVLPTILPAVPNIVDGVASGVTCLTGSLPQLVNGVIRCIAIPVVTQAVNDAASILHVAPSIIEGIIGNIFPTKAVDGAEAAPALHPSTIGNILPGILAGIRGAAAVEGTSSLPPVNQVTAIPTLGPPNPKRMTSIDGDMTHVNILVQVTSTVTVYVPSLSVGPSLTTVTTPSTTSSLPRIIRRLRDTSRAEMLYQTTFCDAQSEGSACG